MNCYKILKISRTGNKELIKTAYRNLVKKYHPDIARTPEKVRINTIKCTEINWAYEEALLLADQIKDTDNSTPESIEVQRQAKKENKFQDTILSVVVLITVLSIFFLGSKGLDWVFSETSSTANIIKIIILIPVIAFLTLLGGFMFSATFALIGLMILDGLLVKLIPGKYYFKLLWLIVVILNSIVAIQEPFVALVKNLPLSILLFNIWPIISLIYWIRTIIKYNALKDKTIVIKTDL
jgi:hypothetical protein